MFDANLYAITVRKGVFEEETCFEARVQELPDLAEYADTAEEARALMLDALETTHSMLTEQGRTMPSPQIVETEYSGRVTLRLPKSLHRVLAQQAEAEEVSLNQHICTALGHFSGYRQVKREGREKTGSWHVTTPVPTPIAERRPHLRVVTSHLFDQKAA